MMLPILLLSAVVAGLLLRIVLRKTLNRVQRPEYTPLPCSPGYRLLNWIGNVGVKLTTGRVELRGLNLDKLPQGALIVSNHPHFMDPFVIASVIKTRPKYMVHPGVYRFFGGLGAFCLSPASIVASRSSIRAGAQILIQNEHLVIFPEGYTNMDAKLLRFHTGAIRIARLANFHRKSNIPIVPIHIAYNRYPQKWILRYQPPLQYVILLLLFPFYRGGVRVTIGSPLDPGRLPADIRRASDFLRTHISTLGMKPAIRQEYTIA